MAYIDAESEKVPMPVHHTIWHSPYFYLAASALVALLMLFVAKNDKCRSLLDNNKPIYSYDENADKVYDIEESDYEIYMDDISKKRDEEMWLKEIYKH